MNETCRTELGLFYSGHLWYNRPTSNGMRLLGPAKMQVQKHLKIKFDVIPSTLNFAIL
jgi:hypothetical protein